MIFNSSHDPDSRFFEGTVLAVDHVRSVCKILSSYRQSFDGVPWLSSIYDPPVFGDRVLVATVTGDPIIFGILPRTGLQNANTPNIDTDTVTDTGNYTSLANGLVNDPDKPSDLLSGDKVISNEMGGVVGLLRGGTFIAKASRLAQIIAFKYDDLVRIIGRNYELFTDSCIDVIASVRGRIYRFKGYADTLSNARTDSFKYEELYGDTVLANSLKWNYYGLTPVTYAAQPVANEVIRKYKILNGGNLYFYQDLYHNDGRLYTKVQTSSTTAYTEVNQTNATYDIKTDNGTSFTRIQTQPGAVTITYNTSGTVYTVTLDNSKAEIKLVAGSVTNTITVNETKIEAKFDDGSIVGTTTMDANKVEHSYDSGSSVNRMYLDPTTASLDFNVVAGVPTHFIKVDSSGVHLG